MLLIPLDAERQRQPPSECLCIHASLHRYMYISVYLYRAPTPAKPPSATGHVRLNRRQDARIAIPSEQRIIAAAGLGILDVRPAAEKVLVAEESRQPPGHGAVDVFHGREVGREEDVEVALVDLYRQQALESRGSEER